MLVIQALNLAIETAMKVAPTEMTVLIQGESGVGKESFSKIIHQLGNRKHGPLLLLIAGLCLKEPLIVNYSGMRKDLLPEQVRPGKAILKP